LGTTRRKHAMFRHRQVLGAGALVALALCAAPAFGVGQPPAALDSGGSVVSPDGAVRYVLHQANLKTSVTAFRVRDGKRLGSTSLAGMWGVAPLTIGAQYGGVSHDGSRLVIAEVGSATRFVVVPTDFKAQPQYISLAGDFAYDAMSPDNQ